MDTHSCNWLAWLIRNSSLLWVPNSVLLCQLCEACMTKSSSNFLSKSQNPKRLVIKKKKRKENVFTSNHPNAKIEMYDGSPKRSEHHASTDQDPADHHHRSAAIAVDKHAAYRSCTDERKTRWCGGILSWSPRLLRLSLLLTSGIHWSEHDWGDPGNLTVGNGEILLNLLVVDGEGLGKGIGESDGNESPEDDGPAPASIWRGVA